MSEPLTMEQKVKEYEKMFEINCHFEHVSSTEDAVSFLKGYGKAVGDAYADQLGKSQTGLLIKCILLVIGLIVMITTEFSASWGALGIVLAPLMARDIVAIKACQEGVKETNSCKDLSAIKWMSEPEIVQFANRVIDDCNSKIDPPPQGTEDKSEKVLNTESESASNTGNKQNDRERDAINDIMETRSSFQGETARNIRKRIDWKSRLGLIIAGTALVGLIGFCIYCAVSGIERPQEPVNLENTRTCVFHEIIYPVPYCFQDTYRNGDTLSLYAERGKRLVYLFFASAEVPENDAHGDVNDILDSVFHRFFENSAGAGNQSEEMECIQNAQTTTLAGMPAKTYQYTDYIEGQDMIITQTMSCDLEKQIIHIVTLTQSVNTERDYSEAYRRMIRDAVKVEQTENDD